MLRWVKFTFIIIVIGVIIYFSWVKINNIVLKDIEVVNLHTIYQKDGFPVYTKTVVMQTEAIFLKDLAIVPAGGKRYYGYVSKNLRDTLKIGSVVFVPNDLGDEKATYPIKPYIGGRVSSISRDVDWATGFYRITVTLDSELPQRTFYSAKVVYRIMKDKILVPITVMRSIGGVPYAWLNIDNRAKMVKLTTGICDGYNCEVVSGLKVGDELITSDSKLLKDGELLLVAKDNTTVDSMIDFNFRGK